MILAHKIALNPNKAQREHFARAAGTARFAWNWALAEWQAQYKAGGKPSDASLRRQLNAIKRDSFPWMYDVSKSVVQEAIIDLGAAYKNFFAGRGRFPRFKSRSVRASFCASNSLVRVDGKRVKLPVIGWVRLREEVRFRGPIKRATVSMDATGKWFVSLMIETQDVHPIIGLSGKVGVDLGVKALATLSTGETIEGPKSHKAGLKSLRRANKALARKKRGSANWLKAKRRLAKVHVRITDKRKNETHKLTSRLAKTFALIGIEDLNVKGMAANGKLARSVMDGGFFEFRRQLEYKTEWYGSRLVVADRWFPSSKTCSCCGFKKENLALADRWFRCDNCGFEIDRDENAANNLATYAASHAVLACGENRSGAKAATPRVKRPSVKQEVKSGLDMVLYHAA